MLYFIALASLAVGVGRFLIPGHDLSWPGTYEALAHIWVGVLLTLGFLGENKAAAWAALGLISVLEVVMAMLR